MRYILVLHTGQDPLVAGLPFFMVTCWGFRISRLVLHLRQYASIIGKYLLILASPEGPSLSTTNLPSTRGRPLA